jgi:hypothetical protein
MSKRVLQGDPPSPHASLTSGCLFDSFDDQPSYVIMIGMRLGFVSFGLLLCRLGKRLPCHDQGESNVRNPSIVKDVPVPSPYTTPLSWMTCPLVNGSGGVTLHPSVISRRSSLACTCSYPVYYRSLSSRYIVCLCPGFTQPATVPAISTFAATCPSWGPPAFPFLCHVFLRVLLA